MSASVPRHIAIILDGNGRWATQRGLPRTAGHEHGIEAVRTTITACEERGIGFVTLYAFSVANWSRPKNEIDALMRLAKRFADEDRDDLARRGIRVQVIGDLDEVPTATRHSIEALVEATKDGRGMTLALALSYGGRRDMVSAIRSLVARARVGEILPEDVDEVSLRGYLTTTGLPDPDLVIRTGGEKRLSDFLLYECAYAELFFTETLWPDFDEAVLDEALAIYGRRQRRYGRVAEQLPDASVG